MSPRADAATDEPVAPSAAQRIAELEAALAALTAERESLTAERESLTAERESLTAERDRLRVAYRKVQQELELLRRRLFVAKAERIDTGQLELEFSHKLAELDALGTKLDDPGAQGGEPGDRDDEGGEPGGRGRRRRKPSGRRDLGAQDLPEVRVELTDDSLEGRVPRNGWEETARLVWRRGGLVRLVVARAKYLDLGTATATDGGSAPEPANAPAVAEPDSGAGATATPPVFHTTALPPQLLPRSLATPSLLAHILSDKFCDGLPFHRQEDRFSRLGLSLDRGTMCRWAEDVGATVGATVVHAMRLEALRTAFCIATDATGVLIQPLADGEQKRRPCRRGHFLVQIADDAHVFFEFMPRETSAAIGELFRGFTGYVQADAKSVFDFLFVPPDERPPPDDDDAVPDLAERHEVGCWSHCRRKFWEAAVAAKEPVAREALLRIAKIFDIDRSFRGHAPAAIKALREQKLRPHTAAFFAWVDAEYQRVLHQRGLLRSALGYAHRQAGPLTRFLDDGRLKLTNNDSERQLRRVAVGRKAWLFVGSDDHAQSAANLLTLVASARLHRLDPEAYLRDLFRVLPHWPAARYLELAPRYWLATRARLDQAQLDAELGSLTLPEPTPPSPEQSPPR